MAKASAMRTMSNEAKIKSFRATFDEGKALIMLRQGNGIDQAMILDKEFAIDTAELGVVKVPTKLIHSVIMRNGTMFPLDVIRLLKGNEISGTIEAPDPVHANSDEVGGKIEIPLSKLLAIVWN